MPNFVKMQQTLAGLAMISTVMSMIAPSAQADKVEVRGLIKAHYERNLTKLQLDKEKEATLRHLLTRNISERLDLFERHGFTPGEKPTLRKMLSMRGDMRELTETQQHRLAAALSPEQLTLWRAIEDSLREKMRLKLSSQT